MSLFSNIKNKLKSKYGEEKVNELETHQLHHVLWGNETPPKLDKGKTTVEYLKTLNREKELLKQGLKKVGVNSVNVGGVTVLTENATLKQLPSFVEAITFVNYYNTQISVYQTSFCRYNKLYVKLTTTSGTALGGRSLTVKYGSTTKSVTTDSKGIASVQINTTGSYSTTVTFKGYSPSSKTVYNSCSKTFTTTVKDFSSTVYIAGSAGDLSGYTGSSYQGWTSLDADGTNICGNTSDPIRYKSEGKGKYMPRPLKLYNLKAKSGYSSIPTNATIYSVNLKWEDACAYYKGWDYVTKTSITCFSSKQCNLYNAGSSNLTYTDGKSPPYKSYKSHSVTWTSKALGGSSLTSFTTSQFTNKHAYVTLWLGSNLSNNYAKIYAKNVSLTIKYKPYQAPMT